MGAGAGTGAIAGAVIDPSGRAVVHAAVSAVSESTGVKRTATTGAEGAFTVSLLSPGAYTVTVSAPFDTM